MAKKKRQLECPLEKLLRKATNNLPKNIAVAAYKYVVLGLIFLCYILVAFEQLYNELVKQKTDSADPEDSTEYIFESVFYVLFNVCCLYWVNNAKNLQIGQFINDAMDVIECENKLLKDVLLKAFSHIYYLWHDESVAYQAISGFCASVPISRVTKLDYILASGRYVGFPKGGQLQLRQVFHYSEKPSLRSS